MKEEEIQVQLKAIRTQLRRSMDGVVASSMRNKGVKYSINFGVTLPRLKSIAQDTPQDEDLALEMLNHDVRELKILATMLYPKEKCTIETAKYFLDRCDHIELIEQLVINLLEDLQDADDLCGLWMNDGGMTRVCAYILLARRLTNGKVQPEIVMPYLDIALGDIRDQSDYYLRSRSTLFLKRLGRTSPGLAQQILDKLPKEREVHNDEEREAYQDLSFELNWYLEECED